MIARVPSEQVQLVGSLQTLALFFVFICLPFFDMLNGYLVVGGLIAENSLASPSQVGRLIAAILVIVGTYQLRVSIIALGAVFILLFTELLSGFRTHNVTGVLFGGISVFRFLYSYLLFVLLVHIVSAGPSLFFWFFKRSLDIVCISIIFAFLTGLGNSTYGWGFGTKGFFASGNGLGIYLGAASIFLIAMNKEENFPKIGIFSIAVYFLAMMLIGSKTSFLLGLIFVFLACWASKLRLFLLVFLTGAILIFWSSIVDTITLLFDVVIIRMRNAPSVLQFLTSARYDYLIGAFSDIFEQDAGLLRWMFGAGSFLSFQDPNSVAFYDTLETDLFDVLFQYGIFGVFLYLGFFVFGLWKMRGKPYFLLGFLMLFGHSLFAGHVIYNAMSMTMVVSLLATIIALNDAESKDQRRSVNFEFLSQAPNAAAPRVAS